MGSKTVRGGLVTRASRGEAITQARRWMEVVTWAGVWGDVNQDGFALGNKTVREGLVTRASRG